MRRRRSARGLVAILSLVALVGALGTYALSTPPIRAHSGFQLDLRQLRTLAHGHAGVLPSRLRVAIVAESTKPAAGVLGGLRLDQHVFVWTAFQVVFPDRFIVIDAPPDEDFHRKRGSPDPFYADQYEAVQQALREAGAIVITHEHPDHIGGIARSPHLGHIAQRLLLTTEQVGNESAVRAVEFPADVLASLRPLDYQHYFALAPGVVLVKAPGHTPGSQLIYVQLASGAELLLVGDVAWHRSHIEEPRGRPRISSWLMGEDRDAVADQLRRLHDLASESNVHLVISHDREQLAGYVDAGMLEAGFEWR